MKEYLVWVDCEMTGLDLGADALIEVAALVTDAELNLLGGRRRPGDQADRSGTGAAGDFVRRDARQVRAATTLCAAG